jgi:hypothetical protein
MCGGGGTHFGTGVVFFNGQFVLDNDFFSHDSFLFFRFLGVFLLILPQKAAFVKRKIKGESGAKAAALFFMIRSCR